MLKKYGILIQQLELFGESSQGGYTYEKLFSRPNQKYCLFISSGNVIVELKNIDYCCVSVGQKIKAQDRVAISMESTMSGNARRMTFFLFMDGTFLWDIL